MDDGITHSAPEEDPEEENQALHIDLSMIPSLDRHCQPRGEQISFQVPQRQRQCSASLARVFLRKLQNPSRQIPQAPE